MGRNGGNSKCTKTDLMDCSVLKNVKVLTHNLADHHLYRTSQIHEVLAIIWCIFSGPHQRIPRIIFCEISVYSLVIPMISIVIYYVLLSPVFVSPSERFPLVFPESPGSTAFSQKPICGALHIEALQCHRCLGYGRCGRNVS